MQSNLHSTRSRSLVLLHIIKTNTGKEINYYVTENMQKLNCLRQREPIPVHHNISIRVVSTLTITYQHDRGG